LKRAYFTVKSEIRNFNIKLTRNILQVSELIPIFAAWIGIRPPRNSEREKRNTEAQQVAKPKYELSGGPKFYHLAQLLFIRLGS
jgi:hypothetical protein